MDLTININFNRGEGSTPDITITDPIDSAIKVGRKFVSSMTATINDLAKVFAGDGATETV